MREFFSAGAGGLCFGLLLGILTTYGLGHWEQAKEWRKETVERGLAHYCSDTGAWAWKGECHDQSTAGD